MKNKVTANQVSTKPQIFLFGSVISLLVSMIFIFLCAGLLTVGNFAHSIAFPLSSLALGIGGFFGSRYVAKKIREKGYLCGLIIGIVLFSVNTVISMALGGFAFTWMSVIRLVIILLMSMLGGILGINSASTKSLVK